MHENQSRFSTVDEYIATFPEEKRALLEQIRATVRAAAPEAEERVRYGMPSFEQDGPVVYFAAFKNHIGLYPAGSEVEPLKSELARYRASKGTLQFPVGEPMPLELITKIVQFRLEENRERAEAKKAKKKA